MSSAQEQQGEEGSREGVSRGGWQRGFGLAGMDLGDTDEGVQAQGLRVEIAALEERLAQEQTRTAEYERLAREAQAQAHAAQQALLLGAPPVVPAPAPAPTQPRLPSAVKLEKPTPFKGQVDGTAVETFIYQCELYFGVTQVTDPSLQVQFATLLLADDAALWLRSTYTSYDIQILSWAQFTTALRSQFLPVDHVRRARDKLAACRQTGGVQGYTAAFRRILVQCPDVYASEALDRYVRGLIPQLRQMVLVHAPTTWEQAAVMADRVATAGGKHFVPRQQQQSSSSQHVPMELGMQQGQSGDSTGRGSGGRGRGRGRGGPIICWKCQKPGHTKRQCQQKN